MGHTCGATFVYVLGYFCLSRGCFTLICATYGPEEHLCQCLISQLISLDVTPRNPGLSTLGWPFQEPSCSGVQQAMLNPRVRNLGLVILTPALKISTQPH